MALAGVGASVFARTVTAPLDVIKIRMQLWHGGSSDRLRLSLAGATRQLWAEEGWRAFFRGNTAGIALYAAYGALQFPIYSYAYSAAAASPVVAGLWGGPALVAGCLTGATATAATYPLDLARTRLASQGVPRVHAHMWDVLLDVARGGGGGGGGVRGLFAGLTPTLLQVVPAAGAGFATYEAVHKGLTRAVRRFNGGRRRGGGAASVATGPPSDAAASGGAAAAASDAPVARSALAMPRSGGAARADAPSRAQTLGITSVAGAVSGVAAKLLVMPLDVIRKHMQVAQMQQRASGVGGHGAVSGVAIARELLRRGGAAHLWRGTGPSVLKAGLGAWATFFGYDVLRSALSASARHS
ncbi:hypothetical protein FNF29_07866 [Cafeteria roenbergensis]|uniref:Uncharacterized protein n=1 Tax=Cafeteria roenbergensis TaxID=33653 RepID=A0A5A8C1X7_CAFRO|nr:hypothetical protein FNF29_07866 [Cafeteria roenbergensis]|eukprot:KAA0146745.1 hypothetical protein FNF29_07866 [Cafeteria roenbergensis]